MNNYKLLVDSLINLSTNYEEQVTIFPDYVDTFDEIVSDFDNAFRLLPSLMDQKIIPYEAVKEIIKCKNLIDLNLSIEERLTDESFNYDECWKWVREYALNALVYLNLKSPRKEIINRNK